MRGADKRRAILSKIPTRPVQTDAPSLTTFLRKGVKYVWLPGMGVIVRQILAKLAAQSMLVFPEGRCSGRLPPLPRVLGHLHRRFWCRARTRTTEELSTSHCLFRPRYPRFREALDPLDLEAGSIVWAMKRLRGCLRMGHEVKQYHTTVLLNFRTSAYSQLLCGPRQLQISTKSMRITPVATAIFKCRNLNWR